ncbi:hypothetical protein RFI_09860 [Reticulomyxa filosa]|uniref:Uncharacterized protein n=1 Tax=Reticulomyxa filosa TaxID=46433 RepID=X6NNI5_RETFI|nr:hypothetical protein RFI_09860 [Reticulomyxa filosa]|eukprot:ETO27274.1 hypothetical protein RFI_09860 [Reticulomyxa filosa]
MRGNGLRRVLHPYINTRTYLSVLFTFSPSINNSKATESTLKFAVTAGMVKVQPVKVELSVNMEQLVQQLRRHIEENLTEESFFFFFAVFKYKKMAYDKLIEEQNDKIMNLRADLEKLLQDAMTAGDLPEDFVLETEAELESAEIVEDDAEQGVHRVYSSTLAKEMTKRQEKTHSTLPTKLLSQLKELDEDEEEEEITFDEKMYVFEGESGKLSQKDVEKEMQAALDRMQKTNRGDEMIKKAVSVDQNKSNVDKTKDAMQQLAGTLAAATFDPSAATGLVIVQYPEEEPAVFDTVAVNMDFSRMNKQELKDVCVDTFDKIEKNREEQTKLQKKQQAVVGHLVETNEWLFNTLSEILNDKDEKKS